MNGFFACDNLFMNSAFYIQALSVTYLSLYFTTCLQDPIVSIAPKKPNWDLRRDVAKKLEKLERRTQRAIVELMSKLPVFGNLDDGIFVIQVNSIIGWKLLG